MTRILQAYWPSVRREWPLGIASLVFMIAGVVLNSMYPYVIRGFVEAFTVGTPDPAKARAVFHWLLVLLGCTWVTYRFFDFSLSTYEARVMKHLDERSFAAIQSQSMRFFENTFSGSLVKSSNRFRNAFEGLTDSFVFQLGRSLVLILVTFVVLTRELPQMALLFGIWIVMFLGFSILAAWRKFPLDTLSAEADSTIGGRLADSIGNHTTVKSFGKESEEQTRFDGVVLDSYQKRLRSWFTGNVINAAQGALIFGFELYLIQWMIQGWEEGTIQIATFVFFQSYIVWMFGNLWDFGNTMRRVFGYLADADEMAKIYALIPEVRDHPQAQTLQVPHGEVTFDHVHFSYVDRTDRQHHDVHNFNLTIAPGETVALVGHSGAGKSTLVRLLLRYYDLEAGRILIDGQTIAKVTQRSLRNAIAMVPQQPELFHRSIADNIRFARRDATDEAIVEAAKRAEAWEFIQNLPHGLRTLVGERGVKLSGGERQRIALARAFLADRPILVLDEATSALDSVTEHQIQKAIADLLKGRTNIVIAHRLSTVMHANRIIVMEQGRIVEHGTHDELLKNQNGVYADLWNHQVGGYIVDE